MLCFYFYICKAGSLNESGFFAGITSIVRMNKRVACATHPKLSYYEANRR